MILRSVILFFVAGSFHSLAAEGLKGRVIIDGSSTVFPISEAIAEEFQKANRKVQVAVASSGTGGGFKKFCKGETDLTGASRPIEKTEIEMCRVSATRFIELPIAYDGIAIVVNKENTWVKTLTAAELKKIWEPGSTIKNWKEIRADFPDMRLTLYGPGPDSGTFDYFTKVINGKEKASRTDFAASESDHVIVKGVAGDKGALGYFGYAYYEANKSKLNLVGVDAGQGAILPTIETISAGTYAPLSRPVFVYVSTKALKRPEVKAFADYYVQAADTLVPQVGYVSLGQRLYSMVISHMNAVREGSLYSSGPQGRGLEQRLTEASSVQKINE
jgi:phosphate transport system substrate-binding protein